MKTKQLVIILFIGCVVLVTLPGCSSVPVRTTGSILTTKESFLSGRLISQHTFKLQDIIRYHVDFTWDDVTQGAGVRQVKWNWYKDGKLVAADKNDNAEFRKANSGRFTMRPAYGLGRGHFKVECIVDDKPMASEEFDIE